MQEFTGRCKDTEGELLLRGTETDAVIRFLESDHFFDHEVHEEHEERKERGSGSEAEVRCAEICGKNHRYSCLLIACCSLLGWGCVSTATSHFEREELITEYLQQPRQVVVIDLDDTVVDGGACNVSRLLFNFRCEQQREFPGAVEAIRQLAKVRDVVFLTARDDYFARRTVRWLDARGFPLAPVIFSTSVLAGEVSKVEYKREAIEDLMQRGLLMDLGIGDKATDMAAYLHNGLDAVLLVDGTLDPDLRRATEGDTEIWDRPYPMLSVLKQVTFDREQAWSEIASRWSN